MMTFGTVIWLVIIGGVIFMMMRKGGGCCGGHDHGGDHDHSGGHDHGGSHDHCSMKHDTKEVQEGGTGKDPVCGMDVGSSDITSTYEDKKYTFCSDNCRKTFEENPGKFTG